MPNIRFLSLYFYSDFVFAFKETDTEPGEEIILQFPSQFSLETFGVEMKTKLIWLWMYMFEWKQNKVQDVWNSGQLLGGSVPFTNG